MTASAGPPLQPCDAARAAMYAFDLALPDPHASPVWADRQRVVLAAFVMDVAACDGRFPSASRLAEVWAARSLRGGPLFRAAPPPALCAQAQRAFDGEHPTEREGIAAGIRAWLEAAEARERRRRGATE